MIKCKDLSYSYGNKKVLSNLNLEIKRGEFIGILGKNGAGKTTLLRLLARMEKLQSGILKLYNKQYSDYGLKEFAKCVSFFPQGRPTPDMDAKTLVLYGKYPYGKLFEKANKNNEEEALDALKKAGAEAFTNRNLHELSYGERQRVYLALSIMQNSDFLLLDEPTNFLDAKSKFSLMGTLSSLAKTGKGIVSVMHDISLAMNYCDKIIIINDEKIVAYDKPQELADANIIENVFDVKCRIYDNEYVISEK